MSKKTINIRPGVSVLSVLKHLNYKPWFAIAEFVDNSLQSYLEGREELYEAEGRDYRLGVSIEIDPSDRGTIKIRDDAGGIADSEYQRAFRPAELPIDKSGLSEFGMGMKSAACWFSPRWSVRTSALGESVEKTVTFDIDHIVEDNIEELDVVVKKVKPEVHYTEIVLSDLYKIPQGRTVTKVKEHLASIYRVFLRGDALILKYNGERLNYEEPAILVAPYYRTPEEDAELWKKEIAFDFGLGMGVRGFAALRHTGSTSRAGFSLFRRKRLIEGSLDEGYRPEAIFGKSNSFIFQRLFGELHLEGFQVSHTKDGFRWEENEQAFLDLLREHLDSLPLPLLKQAEGYRVRPSTAAVKRGIEEATANTARVIEKSSDTLDILDDEPDLEEPTEGPSDKVPIANRRIVATLQDTIWTIHLDVTNDPAVGDWLEFFETPATDGGSETGKVVGIRLSLSHPFMVRFGGSSAKEVEPLLRVAAAIGLAEAAARDSGVKYAGTIRRNVNALLVGALSEP